MLRHFLKEPAKSRAAWLLEQAEERTRAFARGEYEFKTVGVLRLEADGKEAVESRYKTRRDEEKPPLS